MELDDFIRQSGPEETGRRFELENSKLLDIQVQGTVMVKAGSMIAYEGNMTFTGKSSAEGGISGFVKSKVTSEGTPIMEVEGQGNLYVADQGKKVQPLGLYEGESITVNGDDVLAFESSVDYEIGTIGSVSGASAAGLTNVFLSGPGMVAITTHGDPLVLEPPVKTDPDATVAWSSDLSPSINTDRSISDSIGQSSGETYQMAFDGNRGFVVIQPYEETANRQQG